MDPRDELTYERLAGMPLLSEQDVQEALRRLVMVIGALGFAIRNLSGADRGHLKGIEAELTEIGQLLGMFSGVTVEKPTSQWPEGEGRG